MGTFLVPLGVQGPLLVFSQGSVRIVPFVDVFFFFFKPYFCFEFWFVGYDWEAFYLFIYLFMAVLGLRFCARVFSSCVKWGPLFIVVHGPLTIMASLAAEHRLQTHRLSNCGSRG